MIIEGDVSDPKTWEPIEDESVQCCITSPPYWGLRDYGIAGQLGLEKTPDEYVANMVKVFRFVWKKLRKDGTLWLNLGDTYAGSGGAGKNNFEINRAKDRTTTRWGGGHAPASGLLKPKDLCMIPARVALALQADGWWLRSDIIWNKPNPMPESVTDRPTKSHEYIFLLTKSAKYYYDAEAVKEKSVDVEGSSARYRYEFRREMVPDMPEGNKYAIAVEGTREFNGVRNLRSVWTITTKPFSGAHFATFPPELPERCIRAGTSEKGACEKCGSPWERVTETARSFESGSGRAGNLPKGKNGELLQGGGETIDVRRGPVVNVKTLGWQPTCTCNAGVVPCIAFDPFAGSGTTLEVAERMGRKAIGIELNGNDLANSNVQNVPLNKIYTPFQSHLKMAAFYTGHPVSTHIVRDVLAQGLNLKSDSIFEFQGLIDKIYAEKEKL